MAKRNGEFDKLVLKFRKDPNVVTGRRLGEAFVLLAADIISIPKVKRDRIEGAGPRILFAGRAQMIPPQIDITHPELPSDYHYRTAVILTSTSVEPIAVTARGDDFFSVECDPESSEFTFYWMVIATGTSQEFM